jgi:hypothetical protein
MADGDPIIIGRDNIASNPGAETILRRDADSTRTDPVFTVQNDTGVGVRGTSTVAEGVVGKATTTSPACWALPLGPMASA